MKTLADAHEKSLLFNIPYITVLYMNQKPGDLHIYQGGLGAVQAVLYIILHALLAYDAVFYILPKLLFAFLEWSPQNPFIVMQMQHNHQWIEGLEPEGMMSFKAGQIGGKLKSCPRCDVT